MSENPRGPENIEERLTPEQRVALEHLKTEIREGNAGYNDDYVSPETYQRVFNQLGDLRGKKVADLGAGIVGLRAPFASFQTPILLDRGAMVIPIDQRQESVRTWNVYHGEIEHVAPLTANFFHLPFENESLDGIASANTVNLHWSAYGQDSHAYVRLFLEEMARVIKKGGFSIISSFGYYKRTHLDGHISYNNDITEEQILTASELRQAASQMGFTEISDIALDPKRIAISTKTLNERKPNDVSKIEVIEPAAFLLKK